MFSRSFLFRVSRYERVSDFSARPLDPFFFAFSLPVSNSLSALVSSVERALSVLLIIPFPFLPLCQRWAGTEETMERESERDRGSCGF